MSPADREDEAFTPYAGLIFLAVAMTVVGLVLALTWFTVDRWSTLRGPQAVGTKWTLRAGVDP